ETRDAASIDDDNLRAGHGQAGQRISPERAAEGPNLAPGVIGSVRHEHVSALRSGSFFEVVVDGQRGLENSCSAPAEHQIRQLGRRGYAVVGIDVARGDANELRKVEQSARL